MSARNQFLESSHLSRLTFSTIEEAFAHKTEKEVADKIKHSKELKEIRINAEVNENIWQAVLSNTGIERVEFENIDVESGSASELLHALKQLKEIHFHDYGDGFSMKVDNIYMLCQALQARESLRGICLNYFRYGNVMLDAIAGSQSLRSSLTQLNICNSMLYPTGFGSLVDELPRFTSLQSLIVSDSDLIVDNERARAFSRAIENNKKLHTVKICLRTPIAGAYTLLGVLMARKVRNSSFIACHPGWAWNHYPVRLNKKDGIIDRLELTGPTYFTVITQMEGVSEDTNPILWDDIDIDIAQPVSNQSIRSLSMGGWELSPNAIGGLCDALVKKGAAEHLALTMNRICSIGMEHICGLLSNYPYLKSLDLSCTAISDDMIVSFCDSIEAYNTLDLLDLTGNNITNKGVLALMECLVKGALSPKSLLLSQNEFGEVGIKAIACALTKSSVQLEVLGFDTKKYTGISDGAYKIISGALKVNRTLKELRVDKNFTAPATSEGIRALLDGVKVHPSLIKLVGPFFTELEQDELDFYLELNKGARRLLEQSSPLQPKLWPHVLKKADVCRFKSPERGLRPPDVLFYFVKEKSELFTGAIPSLGKRMRDEAQPTEANKRQHTS